MSEFPQCIHCGRPIRRLFLASWWDIGEVAGWICDQSSRMDTVQVYRKIRERLRKGLINLDHHVAPPKRDISELGHFL